MGCGRDAEEEKEEEKEEGKEEGKDEELYFFCDPVVLLLLPLLLPCSLAQ
jgi:hypothetical protein